MPTTVHFQINPSHDRKAWEEITPIVRRVDHLDYAIRLARRAARIYKAEVRLTIGPNALHSSGRYFHYRDN